MERQYCEYFRGRTRRGIAPLQVTPVMADNQLSNQPTNQTAQRASPTKPPVSGPLARELATALGPPVSGPDVACTLRTPTIKSILKH